MSESIVRKVQPFTIGTRLSVPAVPKCQDFTQSYLQSTSLDNCALQHNLNSLYLSRSQVCARDPCLVSPVVVKQVAPVKRDQEEHMAAEDHLNQNVGSPSSSAVSRSIKKITISGKERSESTGPAQQLSVTGSTSENNNNNNNNVTSTSDPHLPRIVGVSCENKPHSQFKVLLKKDGSDEYQPTHGQTRVRLNGEKYVQQISVPESQKKEPQRIESHPHTQNEASAAAASHSDCFTQRNSLFNKEVLQAEAWIRSKLQDLKDGCNIQRCPLQDWEEASQTLQRDLKDFENTLIQLNQMGEQLICKLNPTSDLVKKQLGQLRDQWQTLKLTAANQTRALGGAKNLQEFNKKVDKLEAWIKEKEEEPSLVNVLGENVDKMQLTRRILDLKQDEQLYRNLHEEINHLALKLEKQGKTDGKNISTRRKHINKMWLKVQSHLKNYHANLQLALEVSSFYQQADNTLFAINNMRKSLSAAKEWDGFGDREIRDIASQIMMLDVSVSQLSNLHPALAAGVTQKQSEVKDCWALLHKAFRSDRTTLSPTGSTFTREDADPLTLALEPQGNVGMETQRIMGKEVKEEQNRLKGCVSTVECENGRRALCSQSQEQPSVNHTSPPVGDSPACANDVIVRHQLKAESRKPGTEPKLAAAPPGHPQLHMQLQKFTISADKTLSWLKDNVSMATQVCSIASIEGLEAARRYQRTLEQDILTNRARIEVVKREGRGLVRAQHPGSARIEEFLGQLDVLWEELRRRHQRNAVFLQASEELGFRVVKVLQALGSLEAWLESVELSMKESALAGDPETMSVAERESCLLEKEVAARSMELGALRQEVDRLHGHSHPLTQWLPARMDEVERKYHRVQSALTQQSSELQDTRMLTEFLERVELEESQDGCRYSLGQPLHGEISSAPSLLGLQSSGGGGGEPLLETMGDPVEELREAVEMLNDTVRERGRSQSHDQAIQDLLSKHAGLAVRVEECLCCGKELGLDILERETDLAIQCEPERCGLEALQERQDHLEIDYEVMREEVKEMENLASRLEELCPERVHVLGAKIQATLQAWAELGRSVAENKSRLQEFVQLQDFFRSYLAMISWTEDTRSCIFSDTALHPGKDGQRPLAAELDLQIELKFEEFDELAAAGKNLLDKEHHLTQMVRERLEELRSMLGWILVHWRAQKQQWLHKKSRQELSQDNIYSEATMCSTLSELPKQISAPELQVYESHQSSLVTSEDDKSNVSGDSRPSSLPPRQTEQQEEEQLEDGYEVMNSIGPRGGEASLSESPKPSIVVLKEPSSPALGGTVNLILSFGNTGESQVQVLEPPAGTEEVEEDTSEPVHRPTLPHSSSCKNFWRRCQGLLENTLGSLKRKRKIYRQSANEVSTYLHVKDNNLAAAPVYESITLPRQKSRSAASASPTFLPSSSSSLPSSASAPQTTNVTFRPSTGSGSGFLFSSLKRMGKKRKRKRDARRHTIQKIMGVEAQTDEVAHYGCDTMTYDTHTWPLKESRRKRSSPKSPAGGYGVEAIDYMKNPLLKDIDTECSGEYSTIPYVVSEGPNPLPSTSQVRSHCRFLSLGSVLSFDLPKDMTLIPSIQDIITIAPPESKKGAGTDPDPHSQRHSALSSFKQTRPTAAITHGSSEVSISETQTPTPVVKAPSDAEKRSQPPPPLSLREDEVQTKPCKIQCCLRKAAEQDGDRDGTSQPSDLPIYVNQAKSTAAQKHECLSVHTLIRDLNGHQYHKCARPHSVREVSPGLQCLSQASHMVVNLKSTVSVSVHQDSVDSGISTPPSSIKVCADAPCPDVPQPKVVVGRLVSLQVGGIDCSKTRQNNTTPLGPSAEQQTEPVHLDHQQFEEEEEELEDIWNQTTNYRQSICSDIMYQPSQDDSVPSDKPDVPHSRLPSPKTPDVLYRNLVTASAPNLLVAEFKLPSHIQSLLGYDKEHRAKVRLPPLASGDRRSWAAFPNREPASKTMSVTVNETASDPMKLPDVGDNQRYIYQYREDEEEKEEEEVEEAKVRKEADENTGGSKDQSMSLLSVHMDLDGACQPRKSSQSLEDMEKQEQLMATGGRCFTLSGKPDLQSMEGTLERKHKLQLGGKKAASRGWSSYHAVLHRHTLCFYQDRKDILRGSACGLPLNLLGAECSPAPEYTKKPNCFRLQLRDGSEYLLNAPSRFMMKKWMMKIQANTGQSESVSAISSVPVDQGLPISLNPSLCSGCHGLAKCHCSSRHDVTSTLPRRKPPGAAQTKEIVVLTREFSQMPQSPLRSLDEHPTSSSSHGGCCDDDEGRAKQTVTHRLSAASGSLTSSSPHSPVFSGQDWLSNKRRSHSFTSATYQRIRPLLHPAGGLERGSNYCVTLVVGDKSSDGTSTCRSSESSVPAAAEWQQDAGQDSALTSYASLPRPRNKSVFKKFFGKRDL
ncbi:uncharacterized protein LOC117775298 isoform X2 [Hippoglossus hippoglossus]|uniref:uncharacterized protein LOC117775298 isoform X2 n=1 Tax=Hippoglossus hippoglossus TaxID=8267 RepID=UPI00148C2D38|nr:uncharacterized protein LOC117775298 isoform X2 [Hippoglossus hippoglossus]